MVFVKNRSGTCRALLDSGSQLHLITSRLAQQLQLKKHKTSAIDGRLKNSSLDFEARHPIILPRHHPITDSLMTRFHNQDLHAGLRALLAHIRLQYWPIGGRKTVSKVANV
ncbi:uncharacterized protein LOC135438815 [Drosophila montana]|uniref:uncharacterized protein LOC135438815 n=1 Tax=Drosophila montana TaxID=40370 RepID=UPI00313C0C7C